MTIVNKKKIILFLFYLPKGEDLFFLFVKFLATNKKKNPVDFSFDESVRATFFFGTHF
jgi:hypothetical protein